MLLLSNSADASATLRNTATMVVNNDMYVGFCLVFLKFVEDYLFISRVPLFTTMWPGIQIIERRVCELVVAVSPSFMISCFSFSCLCVFRY